MKWDGSRLAVTDIRTNIVHLVRVRGAKGISVGKTPLNGASSIYAIWIQRHTLFGADIYGADVGLWPYPTGGSMRRQLSGFFSNPSGIAISVSS